MLSTTFKISIYSSDAAFPPRGWPQQKSIQLLLSRHSYPKPCILPRFCSLKFLFFSHFTGGLPFTPAPSIVLIYTYLVNSLAKFHSHFFNTISILCIPYFLITNLNILWHMVKIGLAYTQELQPSKC